MPTATATARYLRISPRKMRLVANQIRGKRVEDAQNILDFTLKRGAPMLNKLVKSAFANAEHTAQESDVRADIEDYVITHVEVNEGPTLKRFHYRARGRAARIRHRMSHVTITVRDKNES